MVVITTRKPDEEIFDTLEKYNAKKIVIISCGTCAALCQTGGTQGLEEWTEKLEQKGFKVLTGIVSEDICDNRVMKKDLRKIDDDIGQSDLIMTLSCGVGTQSVIEVLQKSHPKIPVIVTNNTEFIGMTERIGRFYMRCRGCGDCLLNETGGICPVTTCAKSLMNGPCGGSIEGKCEVGDYKIACGWILIYNRLKEIGRLDLFSKLRPPADWSEIGHQREVVWR
ncbi:MAG: methylenetetrahydrofolate reductase C-terminal domain-containing protein [Candidatus Lokiarchaeota archaeon]|nr:methylenetetrahydrofolate reductase C-terminal domain-containing protein [Candidatus Lokiarchaeota archaeon]